MATTPNRQGGLQERTRRAVRAEIAQAAFRLFDERGFDQTTMDDIAAAVGVSRRSLFRYFASKDDVMLGFLDDLGEQLRQDLAARPPDEPPWTALRRAFDPALERYATDPATILYRLIKQAPSLRARHLDKQDRWQQGLTEELARRLHVDAERDLRPALLAATALSALNVAIAAWSTAAGRRPLSELLDDAFAFLAAGPTTDTATRKGHHARNR